MNFLLALLAWHYWLALSVFQGLSLLIVFQESHSSGEVMLTDIQN